MSGGARRVINLSDLNCVRVSVDEIIVAAMTLFSLEGDARLQDNRVKVLAHTLGIDAFKAAALDWRIVGLSALIEEGVLPAWTTAVCPATGTIQVERALWHAAAFEPLFVVNGFPSFDCQSLLRRLDGSADAHRPRVEEAAIA